MRRRRGDAGFSRVSWDEALGAVADAVRGAGGDRTAIYLTSRGLTNESYYVAGKAARAMGVANIDSAAPVCHAPSTLGLKDTIGVAASTCSLQDVIESDLIVLWGSNVANNQPVFTKYLYLAKQRGARVVVINPYLEPGLERYWVPSSAESALFGTKLSDLHVPVRPAGDAALANAVLKRLIDRDSIDPTFVEAHTEGWPALEAALAGMDLDELLASAGVTRGQLEAFVDEYVRAKAAVFVWSMGITQHRNAVDSVKAIVNVALARGNVGRDGAGLMPIRGHSGVQGGAEMGAYATALPGGAAPDSRRCAPQSAPTSPATAGRTRSTAAAGARAPHCGSRAPPPRNRPCHLARAARRAASRAPDRSSAGRRIPRADRGHASRTGVRSSARRPGAWPAARPASRTAGGDARAPHHAHRRRRVRGRGVRSSIGRQFVQQLVLERAHRIALVGVCMIPSADVEDTMNYEQSELVRHRPTHVAGVPAAALLSLFRRALDRDDDVAQVLARARWVDEVRVLRRRRAGTLAGMRRKRRRPK